jgi:hypothetical protein
MALTPEDLDEIERRFDLRYVTQSDCNRTVRKTYDRIEDIKLDTAKIGTKLNVIVAILGVIGAAVCSAVVHMILGG